MDGCMDGSENIGVVLDGWLVMVSSECWPAGGRWGMGGCWEPTGSHTDTPLIKLQSWWWKWGWASRAWFYPYCQEVCSNFGKGVRCQTFAKFFFVVFPASLRQISGYVSHPQFETSCCSVRSFLFQLPFPPSLWWWCCYRWPAPTTPN